MTGGSNYGRRAVAPHRSRGAHGSIVHDSPPRRRADAEQRRLAPLFQVLLESIDDAVYGLDRHGRYTFISTAAAELLGYAPDELLGQNIHESIHHAPPAGLPCAQGECVMCRVLHSGHAGRATDAVVRRRDGTTLLADCAARPLFEDGVLTGAVVTLAAARRQADSARAHLAALVESSEDAILSKTLDGVIVSWNRGAERLYGYAADEAIGQSVTLLIPPDRAHEYRHIMAQLRRGERIAPYETVRVRKDGRRVAVAVSHAPIRDAAGTITGDATIARDLTARKEAADALRRSEKQVRFLLLRAYHALEQRVAERTRALSALYDVTAVASASLDLGTILDHSLDRIAAVMESEAATIHLVEGTPGGLCLAAARGLSAVLTHGDPLLCAPELVRQLLHRRKPLVIRDMAADCRTARASAVYRSQTYAGVPLRAKGQVLGVLSVIRDAGRRFTADDATLLAAIGDQLGVAVAHARLFAAVQNRAALEERQRLAHDLHDSVAQSLYSLTLFAEAARRAVATDQRHHVAAYVTRLGETAQQALKEMRLLVYELRPSALQREGLVEAVQQRLDAVEKRAGVEARLLVEGRRDVPEPVEAELYHIIQEALNNALKHAAASAVTVRMRAQGARVEAAVIDNGRGFDPHRMRDTGGLGLRGMRERVERLGGALTIQSHRGEGTTVTVRVDSPESSHAGS